MAEDDRQTNIYLSELLTRREYDILALLAQDLSDREIADRLIVSLNTVKWYNRQIFDKLGVRNRRQAVERASNLGLLRKISPKATPQRLPAQTTPFIGRARELEALAHLLSDETNRLITLLAPGGMGKTRLALAAAAACQSQFSDGVCFVSLTPLLSSEQLVPAIADSLGLQLTSDQRTPKQQLKHFLSSKHILLVLDNFEHLLDATTHLTDLLEATPRLHLLVTSRERLHLNSETLFRVGGLTYPESPNIDNALEYTAVQLFLECGRRVHPHLSTEDLPAVIQIYQMTQGMPLAVELAAGWLDALSPSEVAEEIAHGIDFLQTNLRDIPERQRSVVAVFEASWRQLDAEEQNAFRKLSVFRGGFTREAALTVVETRLSTLIGLVNKALVGHVASTNRFEMHELLRQFAEEQLKLSGKFELTRNRHAAYFADFLNARLPTLQSRTPQAALDSIQADFDNIRQAILFLLNSAESASLEGVAQSLRLFFEADVHFSSSIRHPGLPYLSLRLFFEARTHFSGDATTIFRKALTKSYSAEVEVILREGLGDALQVGGAYNSARQEYEQAKLLLPTDANVQHARLLRKQAATLDAQRQLDEARRVLAEAEVTLNRTDKHTEDWWQEWIAVQNGIVSAYFFLGLVEPILGRTDSIHAAVDDYGTATQRFDFYVSGNMIELLRTHFIVTERAMAYARRGLEAAIESGSLLQIAVGHFRLGLTYFCAEDWAAAETELHTGLAIADRIGNVLAQALCATFLAGTYRRLGQIESTKRWAELTLQISDSAGIDLYYAAAKANLGWVAWRHADVEQAIALVEQAMEIWQRVSPNYPVRWQAQWILLGNALLDSRLEDAANLGRELLQQQAPNGQVASLLIAAIRAWDEGDDIEARSSFTKVSELATSLGYL